MVNDNKSIAVGNAILSEAFFRKYGLEKKISGLKSKGIELGRLVELLVAYKLGDNFSILRAHDFIMRPEIRQRFGLGEFDVKTLYRAVERIGENRESIISHFRNRILNEYGREVSDMIFDWTSLVYFGYKPELAMTLLKTESDRMATIPSAAMYAVRTSQLLQRHCPPVT